MPGLHDTLTGFGRAIVRGDELPPLIAQHYAAYDADVALEIYRNNYRGNLHDALAAAYPVTVQLVGEEFFRYMARHYIGEHPSRSGNLHHYGAELADFVAGFEPAQELVYLADVVALECACHGAYFAADAAVLDMAALARVAPQHYADLILQLHPAVHLLYSPYPVAAIWLAHQPGAAEDFHIDLDSGACHAMVGRRNGVVWVEELAPPAAAWLEAIRAGTSLGEATAATLAQTPDFDLQATLLHLLTAGVLSDFSLRS